MRGKKTLNARSTTNRDGNLEFNVANGPKLTHCDAQVVRRVIKKLT